MNVRGRSIEQCLTFPACLIPDLSDLGVPPDSSVIPTLVVRNSPGYKALTRGEWLISWEGVTSGTEYSLAGVTPDTSLSQSKSFQRIRTAFTNSGTPGASNGIVCGSGIPPRRLAFLKS